MATSGTKQQHGREEVLAEAFVAVERRVRAGTLSLTFMYGPPRGGTTASERWLFESFHFDGNVNQPGLLARDATGERERVQATWQTVLDKVEKCEALARRCERDLSVSPVTIVIKETSNVVLPESEMKLWLRVCHSILLVYRNPVLQLESRICCILNRVSAGATAELGAGPELDPRTFEIEGERLVRADTDFSHIDESNTEQTLWEQHYTWMKSNRDFTSLDTGYIRYCALHPLFEEPEVQRECLELWARKHPEAGVTAAQIDACIGTRLEDFGELPQFFHQAFFEWRFGWIEFMAQIERCEGFDNVTLLDMSDLQSGSSWYFDQVERLIVHSSAEDIARAAEVEKSSAAFDVSSRGGEWDTWFLSSCNWDKMSKTADIRPPNKSCLKLDRFPACLVDIFPQAMHDFVNVRCDPRTLRAPSGILDRFVGVDFVSDYVNMITHTPQPPLHELLSRREGMKGEGAALESFLNMVDDAMEAIPDNLRPLPQNDVGARASNGNGSASMSRESSSNDLQQCTPVRAAAPSESNEGNFQEQRDYILADDLPSYVTYRRACAVQEAPKPPSLQQIFGFGEEKNNTSWNYITQPRTPAPTSPHASISDIFGLSAADGASPAAEARVASQF